VNAYRRGLAVDTHQYRADTDAGPHVCADCPLGEHNTVHQVPTVDVPDRYERADE
jgi:hypothetical protein